MSLRQASHKIFEENAPLERVERGQTFVIWLVNVYKTMLAQVLGTHYYRHGFYICVGLLTSAWEPVC